jgi:tRNA(fMet)-specific endonuclease VapC
MTAPSLFLLDTNIVIHYARGQTVGQQIEKDYSLLSTPYRPLICVVTLGECYSFAKRRNWGQSKLDALKDVLSQFVTVDVNALL